MTKDGSSYFDADPAEGYDELALKCEATLQSLVQKLPGLRRPVTKSKLAIWDAGDDFEPIPKRQWLLGNSFCSGFVSGLVASGATGKTALRIAQALSVATGLSLTGEKVHRRSRALLITLEDDEHELRRRVRAAMIHHGIRWKQVKGWLFLSAPMGRAGKLMTKHPDTRQPNVSVLFDELLNDIPALMPDVVILDPLIKAHGLDENDNSAMDSVIEVLAAIAFRLNIAVDFVHHTSKGAADPGNADRARGASAVVAGARLVYTLTPMTIDEARKLGIPEQERRFYVRLDSAKVNITPPLARAHWFRIVGVPLGNGDEVQTVEPWSPPQIWDGIDDAVLRRILSDLDEGPGDGRRYSSANNAKSRAAWKVAQRHIPNASEARCRQVIIELVRSEKLCENEYYCKGRGEPERGLFVRMETAPS